MTFYAFAKRIVSPILKKMYRVEVKGLEHFPEQGGVLLCSNHIDNMDPPILGVTCPRPISFMAKAELFNVPILSGIIKKLNAFPVKRGGNDREALRTGLKVLKEGKVLGLFPEGTRSKTGKLGKGLAGAGYFALRTNAQVIPCAIIGSYRIFQKVKVIYGKPIDMSELREKKASPEEATNLIMTHIQQLLNENR
ncbi:MULTISPECIES: lysophospholipid acyltransferase family protein [Bacillus]|uniref:1-acylglycerol-3-phosphate O-acyltransferase n=1 Tax=Bacillus smithii 7_3_47FAA TaxID=665952 RepID=G9QP82_9BACI|nr:lysophospholipid acyltransferase family protein [Bacillus smithii]AKP47602.1 1-acyl-sn-glycerol-3-phosphate acyltransferase [Bacillus smithii]EHL74137.1 1-acylglycerol-3-phosphate O-acyltransferase [Bacillus smithii 7_3_47FAA]MED0658520.1 lysophospholipid acyltransferase family protein [Bacillus smithii]MED1420150.1 lysophospholipid acyltransferase family protein [Bacillus smithii]MED1455650.1 lysophospholipid acyltransferase family protein [Bacillus smithii]